VVFWQIGDMDGVRLGPGEGVTATENSQPGMAAVPVCALPLNSPQNRVGGRIFFLSQPRIQSISNGWDFVLYTHTGIGQYAAWLIHERKK
jgi:hypothetical protein